MLRLCVLGWLVLALSYPYTVLYKIGKKIHKFQMYLNRHFVIILFIRRPCRSFWPKCPCFRKPCRSSALNWWRHPDWTWRHSCRSSWNSRFQGGNNDGYFATLKSWSQFFSREVLWVRNSVGIGKTIYEHRTIVTHRYPKWNHVYTNLLFLPNANVYWEW